MFNIPVNAVTKVDKRSCNIRAGDRVKLLLNQHGYAALAMRQSVRFSPHEYELYIEDEEFDKLLTGH